MQSQHFVPLGERVEDFLASGQDRIEILPSDGVVGLDLERPSILFHRLVELASRNHGDAKAVMGLGVVGLDS